MSYTTKQCLIVYRIRMTKKNKKCDNQSLGQRAVSRLEEYFSINHAHQKGRVQFCTTLHLLKLLVHKGKTQQKGEGSTYNPNKQNCCCG